MHWLSGRGDTQLQAGSGHAALHAYLPRVQHPLLHWAQSPPRLCTHLGTICPLTTHGRMLVACMPRIALWGGLMMGVDSTDPNTPPLLRARAGGCTTGGRRWTEPIVRMSGMAASAQEVAHRPSKAAQREWVRT